MTPLSLRTISSRWIVNWTLSSTANCLSLEWTADERDLFIAKWVDQLNKLIGPIRKRGFRQAIKELQEKDHDLIIDVRKMRKYVDSEEEEG